MKEETKKPKHLRLAIEIIAIVGIVLVVLAFRFAPWLLSQPVEASNPYADYQKLFNDAINYDYTKGPDSSFEKRIDKALSNENSNEIRYYYNLNAKGEYYLRTGRFSIAAQAFEEALSQNAPSTDYEYLYNSLIECYRGMGDYAHANKYQAILNGSYSKEKPNTDDTEAADDIPETEDSENATADN